MARKSSKTAHVLNLLSGHDSKKENEMEDKPQKPAVQETPAVSIIDKSAEDPVAELIQNRLLDEFEKEQLSQESSFENIDSNEASESPEISKILEEKTSETSSKTVSEEDTEIVPSAEETEAKDTTPIDTPIEENKSLEIPEESPAEEPPDFVSINIMERIVQDKIIYYMRQFDCCTCPRCTADTIALTLNGLPPKYVVSEPSAEAPLLSFYTNQYISEITVEAMKACMQIKQNPRHK